MAQPHEGDRRTYKPRNVPDGMEWIPIVFHPEKGVPQLWELRSVGKTQVDVNIPINSGQPSIDTLYRVDTRQMREKWNKAGGDENPPLGGAKDD